MVEKLLIKIKENISILDVICSLVLGIAFSASPSYYTTGNCNFTINIILKGLALSIVFVISAVIFRLFFIFINETSDKKKKIDILFEKDKKFYKYRVIILALIILLCWMPILVSLYPGTASNDTWGQISQFYNLKDGETLNDWQPILDTIIIGIIIVPLSRLTGNWHLFMFLYVVLQAIATSLAFSYSLVYAKEKLKLNNKYIIIFLVLYSIVPIFPGSVQAINKDALFSWIYVLFFISYIEIVRTNGKCLEDGNELDKIIELSILSCLTKKVGFYVIIISLAVMLLTKITNKKRLLIPFITVIVFMQILLPIMFGILGITKGESKKNIRCHFNKLQDI